MTQLQLRKCFLLRWWRQLSDCTIQEMISDQTRICSHGMKTSQLLDTNIYPDRGMKRVASLSEHLTLEAAGVVLCTRVL